MIQKKINWRTFTQAAIVLAFGLFTSTISFAQQSPTPPASMPSMKQDSWESFKQDLQTKYQKMTNQVADIKTQAADKKINAPALTDAFTKFDAASKDFSDKMKQIDAITPEKRDGFKADISTQLDKLNTAFSNVQEEWNKVNK